MFGMASRSWKASWAAIPDFRKNHSIKFSNEKIYVHLV